MTLRFALLQHVVPGNFGRPSHWDLLLEREKACWTCAIEALPQGFEITGFEITGSDNTGPATVDATRLPDHRKHYLSYEGPLSDNRGEVTQTASGDCEWLMDSPQRIQAELQFTHRKDNRVVLLTAELKEGDIWLVSVTRQGEQP